MNYIYLDHAATTPLDKTVFESMALCLANIYGNADSAHGPGREAAAAVLKARDNINSLIGGRGGRLYFTSGGSESNSWALKGICAARNDKRNRIILSAIEHPSLLNAAEDMRPFGFEVELVYPDSSGIVRPESVESALEKGDAVFVGVMAANNETGVIQPTDRIYEICKKHGVFYFCDCVQTAGALPLDVSSVADGVSISAHKFYGPKGVGALWLRNGVKISRLISGGQQESGLRGGTTNVAGVYGMSEALAIACTGMDKNEKKIRANRDLFLKNVLAHVEDAFLVGDRDKRLACNAEIMFEGCPGEQLVINLDMRSVAVSAGSACSSGATEPSHVLLAMGLERDKAASCVRFTFGRENTEEEALCAAEAVKDAVSAVRAK